MALGQFVAPVGNFIKGDTFDPRSHADRPLIVTVREFKEDFTTKAYPDPRNVVIVDLVDLLSGEPKISVIWGADAIVDRLRGQAGNGEKLPVKIEKRRSQKTSRDYYTIVPLERGSKEMALAEAFDTKRPTAIEDERAKRQAEADARAAENGGTPAAQNDEPLSGLTARSTSAPKALSDDELAAAMANLGD